MSETINGMIIENGVLKSGKECQGDVIIPEGVMKIGDMAFYTNKNITSITINDGCQEIGKFICNMCPQLKYVKVPSSVTKMADKALVVKMERSAGFTHTIEAKEYYPTIYCQEGSFVDLAFKEMKNKDGWVDSHSNEHIVDIIYE